jgi:hypothetical protein
MKSYSVPWINIIVIGVFLYVLGHETINSIIDPTYHIGGVRYVPRAVCWYFTFYGLYKFFTTAYKISFLEEGSIKLYSILRKTIIDADEIIKINSYIMFVDIVTAKGTYAVSSLMDGTANIKNVLLPLMKDKSEQEGNAAIEPSKVMDRNKILKICFIIILVVFAVFVELHQIKLFLNNLKKP